MAVPFIQICGSPSGTYVYSVTVRDGRGGIARDSFRVTLTPLKEIVLWAADDQHLYNHDAWVPVEDSTAAGGVRLYNPNRRAPKVGAPSSDTSNAIWLQFYPDPTQIYKLWVRLKADADSWANDSVWVQFGAAVDGAGRPVYQIGTSAGLPVGLEECSGCGVSGWGWEDDGWGAVNRNGVLLQFTADPDGGPSGTAIHTREDGVSVNQVVLSAEKYLTTRPGTAKRDTTILPKTYPR